MASGKIIDDPCEKIFNECISCNSCVEGCLLLKQIGEDIPLLAQRRPSIFEAYSCSLCGLCEAVCPSSLSIKNMFAETRKQAVANKSIDIDEYRYMFPDRKVNVMSLFREINCIDYQELCPDQKCPVAFFPGCTLLTYSPELTRTTYFELKKIYKKITLLSECCGLPLSQLGLSLRFDNYVTLVQTKMISLGIKKIIVACPNCYYQLRPVMKQIGIEIVTIYEALTHSILLNKPLARCKNLSVTVHDSCPDRFEGIFAKQSREALQRIGYKVLEMAHNHSNTVCCGSGGQVTHFQPELARDLVFSRLEEAEKTKANFLTSNCMGCILNLARIPGKIHVQHALNLLFGLEEDFSGVKAKSKTMFEGPKGEEYWQRIMAE